MGGSNEDSETQVESEAKDAEENIDDNGTPGNQIRVVAFMCTTFSTRFIFTKKWLQNVFLEICNAEIALLTKIERQFCNSDFKIEVNNKCVLQKNIVLNRCYSMKRILKRFRQFLA